MAPDSCDLYVKKTSPQPGTPTPSVTPQAAPAISFWPIPTSLAFGTGSVPVDPALSFTITPANADLTAYAARISALVFTSTAGGAAPAGAIKSVVITVANPSTPLTIGVDESYTLNIPADGSAVTLTANTTFGAYWGLQTLSQAIRFSYDTQSYGVAGVPVVISDEPAFAWRGMLVDTDRHWLSLSAMMSIVDSLTYAKLNVLHWHIVDWQSWPLESIAYPKLWTRAWSPRERYTLKDIAAIVEYARARGVNVVPEFDTPGHASSMCFAYPELCCSASCGANDNHPLSPVPDAQGNNVALNAINAVLGEIAAVTPNEFFHLGGDEVDQSCWTNTPAVQTWMQQNNIKTTDGVYEYFVSKVDSMTLALGKSPVRWEEVSESSAIARVVAMVDCGLARQRRR